jgi:hypothetical protein
MSSEKPLKTSNSREIRRFRARRKKLRRNIVVSLGIGSVAAFLILAILLPSLPGGSGGGDESPAQVGLFHPSIGNDHVQVDTNVVYSTVPPTSGAHYDQAAPWGIHDEVVDEQMVHNMEHGGIVISHNLGEGNDLQTLHEFVQEQNGFPGCFIVRKYTDIVEGLIVFTAWEWLQEFQIFDRDSMQKFIDAHVDRGPEALGTGCGPTGPMLK